MRGPEALLAAIRRCRESASSGRVEQYRAARAADAESRMAVLVQRMISPDAAGVAFTANPVTGARDEVVITAARGLGERVVSGDAVGDEWLVKGGEATRRRSVEDALEPAQAIAIAALARRVEDRMGGPQDGEWAIAGERPHLLQARPMTALPEPAAWVPPRPGFWMRNLRLGEWLPEPMTPLFRDWLLERLEEGSVRGTRRTIGTAMPFPYAAINGWYYVGVPRIEPLVLLRAVVESRGAVLRFVLNALIRVGTRPEVADRALLGDLMQDWRQELLPRYRRLVAAGTAGVEQAGADQLAALIDEAGLTAGEYLWSLAIVGGSAWKMEGCLAKFLRDHRVTVPGGVQVLLSGLPGAQPEVPAHAVQSVDWYHPTAGELGWAVVPEGLEERRRQLTVERERAEAACREAMAGEPRVARRFETLLAVAQRYAAVREEQARDLTLAWPLLRRCALRLGEAVRARGAIERREDVFFLTRAELSDGTDRRELVSRRRAEWERQRRLIAPLSIGKPPRILQASMGRVLGAARATRETAGGAITGEPASPGRAVGAVRIVRGAEDFDRFQPGEVLVAQATAPAWTPLFARAAAVVTDGGTLAAHASLVAREYGIPAVVATGTATSRLRNGQVVTVDGSAGVVEVIGAAAPLADA